MNLSAQAQRMIKTILLVNVLAALIALLAYRSQEVIPFLLGLLLGLFTSLLRVFLLEKTVNKIMSDQIASEKKAKISVELSHLGRLALTFIVFLIGALVDGINLLGVVVGIFSYQLGTYTLYSTLKSRKGGRQSKDAFKTESDDRSGQIETVSKKEN